MRIPKVNYRKDGTNDSTHIEKKVSMKKVRK